MQEVARRHPRCILIDGRRELAAISPNGLIGDRVIQDTHHPTLIGHVALAGAVLRELQDRHVFPNAKTIDMPLDPTACARHFDMDAAKWATLCDRTSVHYRRVAGYRYDPAERLEKSRRYAEAASRIRSGIDPSIGPRGRGPRRTALDRSSRSGLCRVLLRTRLGIHLLDLPVLQIDGGTPTEEVHHGDELIAIPAADDRPGDPGQRTGHDPDLRAHGHHRFGRDGESRTEHRVDLPKVADEPLLVDDRQDVHQSVPAKCGESVVRITVEEDVTRKERHHRLDFPSSWRSTFLDHLG